VRASTHSRLAMGRPRPNPISVRVKREKAAAAADDGEAADVADEAAMQRKARIEGRLRSRTRQRSRILARAKGLREIRVRSRFRSSISMRIFAMTTKAVPERARDVGVAAAAGVAEPRKIRPEVKAFRLPMARIRSHRHGWILPVPPRRTMTS